MKKLLTILSPIALITTISLNTISCKETYSPNLKDIICLNNLKYFKDNWNLKNNRETNVIEEVIKIIKAWPDYNFYETKMDENIIIVNYKHSGIIRIIANPNQTQYVGFFDFLYYQYEH